MASETKKCKAKPAPMVRTPLPTQSAPLAVVATTFVLPPFAMIPAKPSAQVRAELDQLQKER
jgi:hypothetical protein